MSSCLFLDRCNIHWPLPNVSIWQHLFVGVWWHSLTYLWLCATYTVRSLISQTCQLRLLLELQRCCELWVHELVSMGSGHIPWFPATTEPRGCMLLLFAPQTSEVSIKSKEDEWWWALETKTPALVPIFYHAAPKFCVGRESKLWWHSSSKTIWKLGLHPEPALISLWVQRSPRSLASSIVAMWLFPLHKCHSAKMGVGALPLLCSWIYPHIFIFICMCVLCCIRWTSVIYLVSWWVL